MFRLLRCLDHCALVQVALVVDVELAKGILEAEDLALVELGVLSACNGLSAGMECGGCGRGKDGWRGGNLLLQLDDVHDGEGQGGGVGQAGKTIRANSVSAWLSRVDNRAFSKLVVFLVRDDVVVGLMGR